MFRRSDGKRGLNCFLSVQLYSGRIKNDSFHGTLCRLSHVASFFSSPLATRETGIGGEVVFTTPVPA